LEHRTFNIQDEVPDLRKGLSETTKWGLMFLLAVLGFAAGPIVTLIQAPKKDDWSAQRDSVVEMKIAIAGLKAAADAHIQIENERENLRKFEYINLKELIEKHPRR